jgi:lipopolysaccharide transport system permease protein
MFSLLKKGFNETVTAFKSHAQWLYLGTLDIRLRYRRSMIGPWWVTISTGIMILMLSYLWSHIFGSDISTYMPFFATGFVLWGWMAANINEAASGFFPFQGVIKQINLPFPIFILRSHTRQFIVLLHNSLIIALVLILVGPGLYWSTLIAIPSLLLIQMNLILLCIIIAIFCTRYQDMTQVVNVSTQIIFFFTPILWQVESIKNKAYLAEWNPIYHWIEIIRAPLLGHPPSESDVIWSVGSMILLGVIAIFYLGRYRSRIAYWI